MAGHGVWLSLFDGRITGGLLYGCATDMDLSGQSRMEVSLDLDPSANGGDLRLVIFSDGAAQQQRGNLPAMSAASSPDGGVEVAVAAGTSTWSAEFCLPESVLGTWSGTPGIAWTASIAAGRTGT